MQAIDTSGHEENRKEDGKKNRDTDTHSKEIHLEVLTEKEAVDLEAHRKSINKHTAHVVLYSHTHTCAVKCEYPLRTNTLPYAAGADIEHRVPKESNVFRIERVHTHESSTH